MVREAVFTEQESEYFRPTGVGVGVGVAVNVGVGVRLGEGSAVEGELDELGAAAGAPPHPHKRDAATSADRAVVRMRFKVPQRSAVVTGYTFSC
ncbi:hypothetical protein [Arthrobacter sp. U41]|uniref:hypothetical protein n=1 Tax=Arthrobacter sp. U41 TaxID=1849032 RepID=UPI0012FCC953|nr:hypothetical protein [Arthrobacter sp. U41]